jgi:hypothetical protein
MSTSVETLGLHFAQCAILVTGLTRQAVRPLCKASRVAITGGGLSIMKDMDGRTPISQGEETRLASPCNCSHARSGT